MVLPLVPNAIAATALWVYGVVFLTIGGYGLGYCDEKGVGIVCLVGGLINTTLAILLILLSVLGSWLGIGGGLESFYIIIGLLIFHFGIPALTVGWGNLHGIDPRGASVAGVYIALFILVYAPFFIMLNMWWFAVNVISWSWVVFSFVLVVYGKLSPKIMGWTFIIEAIYTTFIPASILMLGLPLP